MKLDATWMFVNRPATLVFVTIHWDKAGETSSHRVVKAEIADVDEDGLALLATRTGIPVEVPVAALFPTQPGGPAAKRQSYIGGHELTRNFHPHSDEARTVRRWLSREEVGALLAKQRGRRK